jgi:hypothetical protein
MTSFKVGDIQANPFRRLDRYPVRQEKIDALRESLRTTGFWDNVVARIGPDGKPQIAYGHHRLQALKEEWGPGRSVNLIIRELDDEQMLKIMVRENMEEYGSSGEAEHETVRAVVEAFAAGKIHLPALGKRGLTQARIAPSFILAVREKLTEAELAHAYSSGSLASFTGWMQKDGRPQYRGRNALNVLEVIERGLLEEKDFKGLSSWQAGKVAEQTLVEMHNREKLARITPGEDEKKKILRNGHQDVTALGRRIISDLTSEEGATSRIKESVDKSGLKTPRKSKPPPNINTFATNLATRLDRIMLAPRDSTAKQLELFIEYQDRATPSSIHQVEEVLRDVANRLIKYADQLQEKEKKVVTSHEIRALGTGKKEGDEDDSAHNGAGSNRNQSPG